MKEKNFITLENQIRETKPIVHCITNYVTANDCANILLAAGASATMAHASLEMAEIQAGCQALVCNLGATESFDAMLLAAEVAEACNHPIVIDPVGCGGSTFRRDFFFRLIEKARPTCVRGNYAEITALYGHQATVTGVDASAFSEDEDGIKLVKQAALGLAKECQCLVLASGKVDFLASPDEELTQIEGGDVMMSQITGAGCMSSALLGAYLSVAQENVQEDASDYYNQTICEEDKKEIKREFKAFEMAASACCKRMKSSGEEAARLTREQKAGTMTFRNYLIDEISLG